MGTDPSHIWDLLGQLDGLGEGQGAGVDGALHIDVLNLLAEVCLGADQADQTILDLQRDVCALFNSLGNGAGSLDDEVFSTRHQRTLAMMGRSGGGSFVVGATHA